VIQNITIDPAWQLHSQVQRKLARGSNWTYRAAADYARRNWVCGRSRSRCNPNRPMGVGSGS